MEGYSEKETAETLHISVAALKSRVFRARNRLKNMMIEEGDGS
jgi:DNA-directed RNA polymerase specialized sigma24 family protein